MLMPTRRRKNPKLPRRWTWGWVEWIVANARRRSRQRIIRPFLACLGRLFARFGRCFGLRRRHHFRDYHVANPLRRAALPRYSYVWGVALLAVEFGGNWAVISSKPNTIFFRQNPIASRKRRDVGRCTSILGCLFSSWVSDASCCFFPCSSYCIIWDWRHHGQRSSPSSCSNYFIVDDSLAQRICIDSPSNRSHAHRGGKNQEAPARENRR